MSPRCPGTVNPDLYFCPKYCGTRGHQSSFVWCSVCVCTAICTERVDYSYKPTHYIGCSAPPCGLRLYDFGALSVWDDDARWLRNWKRNQRVARFKPNYNQAASVGTLNEALNPQSLTTRFRCDCTSLEIKVKCNLSTPRIREWNR